MDGKHDGAATEAAEWLARLNRQRVAAVDIDAFYRWRGDAANAAAYAHVERLWRDAERLGDDPDVAAEVAAALAPRSLASRRALPLASLAALAAAVLALALWLMQPQRLTTAVGEQRVVRLDDGTRVRLDTATRLAVTFGDAERRVVVADGRAFFEVAAEARPFVVRADGADVRALGTAFEVRYDAAGDDVRVVLVEGALAVDAGTAAARLAAGEQLAVTDGVLGRPVPADTAALTSWTRGRLTFQAMRLADAVAEVNRYTDTPLRLEADALRDVAVSGVFECGDTEAFVAAVTTLFPLRAARRDGHITLIG